MSAFDPPGDPGGVRAAADRVGAVAGSARHLAEAIRAQGAGMAAPGVWAGQDAGAFLEAVGVVADGLVQDADRLDSARTSLRIYADCLERAQATVASIQDEIGDLRDDESDDPLAPVDHSEEIRRLERKVEQVRGDAKVAGNATARSLDGLQPAEVPGPGPIATALTGLTELADGFGQAAAPYMQMLLPTPLKGLADPNAGEHGAQLGDWAATTWQDPATGLEQAKAWVVSGLRDAVAAEDWERGDWVAGLGKTLLPDAAYEIGAAEVAWMGRTWQDPAAGFAEARDFLGGKLAGLVQADLWRQGRWVEAGARILGGDEAVDDWRHGHQARAVGRLVPDMIINLLTGGEAKAVTATKVVTGEVIESAAEVTTRNLVKDTVTIIDGDDLVIRAETVPDGWVAASDPPARLADAVPDPKPVQPPAPLAIDDPALRADQLTRLRDWFREQARLFDYSVSDGGRRIWLHTANDLAGQAIENFWQRYGREMWLAEPGRKVVSIHGALDFGAFAVGFEPSDFAIPLTPKGLAQWLRPALVEGELSEVLLLACKAGALDAGLQSRIAARIDQVVAGLAGSVPDDLGPALRRVVGDVLANQATEAAGGKPYLGWAVSEWLYEQRDRMWRDRHLGGLYETITSPWQLRLKEHSSTADALGRLTPEQLDALLAEGMDAYARHQGRTFKAFNELEAGLMDQLDQLPWTHTGADIEAAVRAKVAEAVNAAMGPAADVGLIDRIATAVDGRLSQWLSNGIDETTVTRITEAVGPVLAANADTLGDRARQFLDDLTGAMADEIAKAYDVTLAQQFADELGVPVIGGRQNVKFMRDGSAWGVDGFNEPWKYGMRRFLPKGSVPPDVPGVVGPLPPLLGGDMLAQAVAAGPDDGWLARLRRLIGWPPEPVPPVPSAPAQPAPLAAESGMAKATLAVPLISAEDVDRLRAVVPELPPVTTGAPAGLQGMTGAREFGSLAEALRWADDHWGDLSRQWWDRAGAEAEAVRATLERHMQRNSVNALLRPFAAGAWTPDMGLPKAFGLGTMGDFLADLANMDAVTTAVRVPEDVLLHRAVPGWVFRSADGAVVAPDADLVAAIKGTVQHDPGFMSTSLQLYERYLRGRWRVDRMVLRVPAGTPAAFTAGSRWSEILEMTLGRGVDYYIHDVIWDGVRWVIDAEVLRKP